MLESATAATGPHRSRPPQPYQILARVGRRRRRTGSLPESAARTRSFRVCLLPVGTGSPRLLSAPHSMSGKIMIMRVGVHAVTSSDLGWNRSHPCYMSAKSMAAFWSAPRSITSPPCSWVDSAEWHV